MKGTSFQKPLEFNLRIDGETWHQGDPIKGVLILKNHGVESVSLEEVKVHLAWGSLKKVRAKAPDAFHIMSSAPPESLGKIEPQKELEFPWTFSTDRNCAVTDANGSLFLIYGNGSATEKLGQLQLNFRPFAMIEEFLEIFKIQFRFVVKNIKFNTSKAKGGIVEVKLAAPTAQAFASLEQLVLSFYFEEETMNVDYAFQVKKLDATSVSLDMKKQKRETSQSFAKNDYLLPSGRVNHPPLEAAIQRALELVAN